MKDSRPPRGGVDRNSVPSMRAVVGLQSPPTRGRGSKHGIRNLQPSCRRSPPTRGRGSKPIQSRLNACRTKVAPHAGAWIETLSDRDRVRTRVSPPTRGRGSKRHTGHRVRPDRASPPTRGRGSKPASGGLPIRHRHCRPPRGGVDRNTPLSTAMPSRSRSPPTRGRGSKRLRLGPDRQAGMSPPTRGRGSKHDDGADDPHPAVAPHAGAWIETWLFTRP